MRWRSVLRQNAAIKYQKQQADHGGRDEHVDRQADVGRFIEPSLQPLAG